MRLVAIALVALLVAGAFAVLDELITRDAVGPFEYAIGALSIGVLLTIAVRISRRALERG